MGVWLVGADVLASARFVTSPLIETVNALGVLAARNPQLFFAAHFGGRPRHPRG